MLATVKRAEALRLLKIEHGAVFALIEALRDAEMTRRDTIRHGLYADQQCSFKDLLAHLVCYEAVTLEAVASWRTGARHWILDAMDDPRENMKLHYGGIAERQQSSLAQQIGEYREVSAGLEALLAEMRDTEWQAAAPFATTMPLDLGGLIERVMVMPPRPMYRHLPVHIPDSAAYIRRLRS